MSLRTASFALITAVAMPGVVTADTNLQVAAERSSTPVQAVTTEASRDYQQREAKDKTIRDYRGGSTVMIAMSGGAFILLLFLLLLI